MASIFKVHWSKTVNGKRIAGTSKKWYIEYTDADGEPQRVPGYTDRGATEQLAARLERESAHRKEGLIDPYADHRKRPLAEHLADFERALVSKGNTAEYVRLVISRLTSLFDGCAFKSIADLSASRVADWLASLRVNQRILELPSNREVFTPRETATMLGITVDGLRSTMKRLRLKAEGNGKARRLSRSTVESLLERTRRGKAVQTTNYYLAHAKTFCRWLAKDRRMPDNPLDHLEAGNTNTDRRHDRRELDAVELRRLLDATQQSEQTFRGLSGQDRFALYAIACGTGFRASALASLTLESFDLDRRSDSEREGVLRFTANGKTTAMPTVTLAARFAKNRKTKVQPIPPDVADVLRDYLRGKAAGKPIWGGTWAKNHRGAEMLRIDLEAAGIPYEVPGPDGQLYADFHALRHSYLTLLGRGGVDLRTAQELAGHSTPMLTARYVHRRHDDLANAADKLPNFLPNSPESESLRMTGTDSAAIDLAGHLAGSPLVSTHSDALACTTGHSDALGMETKQSLEISEDCADIHPLAPSCMKVSDGIRTRDVRNHNPVL
jgi:integrase/recombinase XerC